MFGKRNTPEPPPAGSLAPLWHWRSRILAVEQEGSRISSLVYSGKPDREDYAAVRRLDFSPQGKVSLRWEYQFPEDYFTNSIYGRLNDLLLLPVEEGGVIAVDLSSGERRWEANYASPLRGEMCIKAQQLLLVFKDQAWLKVDPSSGAVAESGRVTNDEQLSQLTSGYQKLLDKNFSSNVRTKEVEISIGSNMLEVTRSRTALKKGEYPIEEWQPAQCIGIVAEKLVLWLERKWDSKKHFALGILSLSSLEPLRLLQIGVGGWTADCDGLFEVDGLLCVRTEIFKTKAQKSHSEKEVTLLIDVKSESFAAYFAADEDSVFWSQSEPYWKGKL